MKIHPVFPLAQLGPLGALIIVAAVAATIFVKSAVIANGWAWLGLLPLLVYLAYCYICARKQVLAEQGRERDIVRMSFIAMVAERSARFWDIVFATVAISTCVTTLAIWTYQGWLWHSQGDWISVTWLTVAGAMPLPDQFELQRLIYWLADTNFGVVVLIGGLLVAAPLAAISWRSNNKAKFRKIDLVNLKKRS